MGFYAEAVQKLYVAYINRPADPAGLAFWEVQLQGQAGNPAILANAFASSPEFLNLYAGLSNAELVNQVYLNLFGRSAEASGRDFWADLLNRRQLTIADVTTAVSKAAVGSDLIAYNAKVSAALLFTAALDTPLKTEAYASVDSVVLGRHYIASVSDAASLDYARSHLERTLANLTADVFQLTAGVDQLTGTAQADIFVAGPSGLSAGDVLDGEAGEDTLWLVLGNGAAYTLPSTVSVSHIETVLVNASNALQFDASQWADVRLLDVSSQGATRVAAAPSSDIAGNVVLKQAKLSSNGGHDVSYAVGNVLAQASNATTAIEIGAQQAPSGAVLLEVGLAQPNVIGQHAGAISIRGGTSISVNQSEQFYALPLCGRWPM